MDNVLSNKIKWFNLIFIFQILLKHATRFSIHSTELSELCNEITSLSMAFFFFVSGFLFFYNFDISKIKNKYKSRVRSLLVPFILWNLIGWGSTIILQLIFGRQSTCI